MIALPYQHAAAGSANNKFVFTHLKQKNERAKLLNSINIDLRFCYRMSLTEYNKG